MTDMNERRKLQESLAYDETLGCVQCGYCLPVCPTYGTMGKETHSPRGRIHLVKMMAEGRFGQWSLLADSLDKCLGCRACETACPSGVKYGSIFESAKAAIASRQSRPLPARAARRFVFRGLFPSKRRLNVLSAMLWGYQKSGLERAVNRFGWNRVLPKSLAAFSAVLPRQTSPLARMRRPRVHESRQGTPRFRVAFFTGCVMDAMFERINRLGMELLAASGCEVVAIPGETCCGALHAHAGEREFARELARRNIEAAERLERSGAIDYVINSAGGCGAMLAEYPHLFADDPAWRQRAAAFAYKSKDISEVLVQLDLPFVEGGCKTETITYQPSCHMTNVQKVISAPLQLLDRVPGAQLEEMADKDRCCGSAGIYNIVNYKDSMDILDVKMRDIQATRAVTVVTTNPGCLLQIRLGIKREGWQDRVRAVHLVELLAEACGIGANNGQ